MGASDSPSEPCTFPCRFTWPTCQVHGRWWHCPLLAAGVPSGRSEPNNWRPAPPRFTLPWPLTEPSRRTVLLSLQFDRQDFADVADVLQAARAEGIPVRTASVPENPPKLAGEPVQPVDQLLPMPEGWARWGAALDKRAPGAAGGQAQVSARRSKPNRFGTITFQQYRAVCLAACEARDGR